MMVLLRVLLMIALAVVTAAPQHVHAAPAAAHHVAPVGHAHHHGAGQHDNSGEQHSGTTHCCASLSVQCGGPALALGTHWAPAELRFADLRQEHEQHAGLRAALPEFEPPPPRG